MLIKCSININVLCVNSTWIQNAGVLIHNAWIVLEKLWGFQLKNCGGIFSWRSYIIHLPRIDINQFFCIKTVTNFPRNKKTQLSHHYFALLSQVKPAFRWFQKISQGGSIHIVSGSIAILNQQSHNKFKPWSVDFLHLTYEGGRHFYISIFKSLL